MKLSLLAIHVEAVKQIQSCIPNKLFSSRSGVETVVRSLEGKINKTHEQILPSQVWLHSEETKSIAVAPFQPGVFTI